MAEVNLPPSITKQELKAQPITETQLEELHQQSGSYEALFNKRAQLYRQRDLKNKNLGEEDFKALLLEHYTFLKRPIFIIEKQLFAGNSKKTVAAVKQALNE